jgi:hypothetical protein
MAKWGTPSAAEARKLERIATELGSTGLVLPGSVLTRSKACGKANCACMADPPRLHGPYHQWSRRDGDKMVHVNLSDEQLSDYRGFFDGDRRLRALVRELEELSLRVIGRDPRLGSETPQG